MSTSLLKSVNFPIVPIWLHHTVIQIIIGSTYLTTSMWKNHSKNSIVLCSFYIILGKKKITFLVVAAAQANTGKVEIDRHFFMSSYRSLLYYILCLLQFGMFCNIKSLNIFRILYFLIYVHCDQLELEKLCEYFFISWACATSLYVYWFLFNRIQ